LPATIEFWMDSVLCDTRRPPPVVPRMPPSLLAIV